jgi:hypothetical protein
MTTPDPPRAVDATAWTFLYLGTALPAAWWAEHMKTRPAHLPDISTGLAGMAADVAWLLLASVVSGTLFATLLLVAAFRRARRGIPPRALPRLPLLGLLCFVTQLFPVVAWTGPERIYGQPFDLFRKWLLAPFLARRALRGTTPRETLPKEARAWGLRRMASARRWGLFAGGAALAAGLAMSTVIAGGVIGGAVVLAFTLAGALMATASVEVVLAAGLRPGGEGEA